MGSFRSLSLTPSTHAAYLYVIRFNFILEYWQMSQPQVSKYVTKISKEANI